MISFFFKERRKKHSWNYFTTTILYYFSIEKILLSTIEITHSPVFLIPDTNTGYSRSVKITIDRFLSHSRWSILFESKIFES